MRAAEFVKNWSVKAIKWHNSRTDYLSVDFDIFLGNCQYNYTSTQNYIYLQPLGQPQDPGKLRL